MTDNSKNSTQATEYAVTAIRRVLCGENASDEERNKVAEELVYSVKPGTPVQLIHESGNPYDENAVGVYMEWKGEYRHIGYISKTKNREVRLLLGEDEIGEGEVTGVASHVALYIKLVGVPEVVEEGIRKDKEDMLPSYPLKDTIQLRQLEREGALLIVMQKIRKLGTPKVKNVREIISQLKRFVNFVGKSLCHEDGTWLADMKSLSCKLIDAHSSLGLTEQECDEVGQLERRMQEMISDSTCNKDREFLVEIMEKELDEYRKQSEGENGLFEKYDTCYLKNSLENADKRKVSKELKRLKHWLEKTKWAELSNYKKKKEAFAKRLNYTDFTRCELRKIYAVILLIERLEARAAICATDVNVASHDKPKEAEGDPLTTSVSEERDTGHDRQPQLDSLKLANLAKYVPQPERVEDIARQLQTVKCAQDFKQVVQHIYDMCVTKQERATIVTKTFREALMLFINDWHPTDNAVYRQCYEIHKRCVF